MVTVCEFCKNGLENKRRHTTLILVHRQQWNEELETTTFVGGVDIFLCPEHFKSLIGIKTEQ